MPDTARPSAPVTARARRALVLSHSAGKDSQAMAILLARVVRPEQMLVVDPPLRKTGWLDAIRHTKRTTPIGVPLVLAPDTSAKTLLDGVAEATVAIRGVRARSLAQLPS